MQPPLTPRYGVIQQTTSDDEVEVAAESIRHLGYAVIDGGFGGEWLASFSEAFERARTASVAAHGGYAALKAADEHNTIRLPMLYERAFLELATNPRILELCRRLIAGYVILNQQNGIINPPNAARYNQAAWHRDLPYQHFTSSRPLALNALFCLDAFTLDNGATRVLPASHRQEAFPSEQFVAREELPVTAPAGSYIVLDAMTFHTGGVNATGRERRAVNHLYTIPHLRQQIDLPDALGDDFVRDAGTRRLLGYEVRTPRSAAEFIVSRRKK